MKKKPKYISTNVPGWFRDPKTGATLNLDKESLINYRLQVEKAKEQKKHDDEMKVLEEKINKLESMISRLLKEQT